MNPDVIEEFFERFNAKDIDGVLALASTDCTYAEPLIGAVFDRDEWERAMRSTLDRFPDRRLEIHERLNGVEGVAIRSKWIGAPPGSPQDRSYEVLLVFDVREGQITRVRGYY